MTSPGSFDERIRYLSEQVGDGNLVMGCTVDQPYAQDQHETERYRHQTGRSHYLGGPLLENALPLVERLANAAITETGSRLTEEAKDIAETLSDYVVVNAPKDTALLSQSASPWVDDNGARIWQRPPRGTRRVGQDDPGWDDV